MKRTKLHAALLALTIFPVCGQAQSRDSLTVADAEWNVRELADGVEWKSYHFRDEEKIFGAEEYINLLVVDQDKARGAFRVAVCGDKPEPTSQMAQKADALAAVNGSNFSVAPPYAIRSYLRLDGQVLSANEPAGDYLTLDSLGRVKLEHNTHVDWIKAPTVLGCGPALLFGGKVLEQKSSTRDPRTAIATDGNTVLLITVDGRSFGNSSGVTLSELAELLRWLGAENALALDGGNAATMYIRGEDFDGVVNHPSGNGKFNHKGEQAVANALLLCLPEN